MKKFLEDLFGCKVNIVRFDKEIPLPLFMVMRNIEIVEMNGQKFALVDVVAEKELTVNAMRKQAEMYKEFLQMPVAYKVELSGIAMRNALIKSRVNFIDESGNVFLPFLGILLQNYYKKKFIKSDKMMPATQMVFLELLYENSAEGGY